MRLVGLRGLRLERNLSQRQLAEGAGVEQGAISGYETGVRRARTKTAERLAAVLGVGVEDLVEPEAPEPESPRAPAGGLVGIKEAAGILGVSPQQVKNLDYERTSGKRKDFPVPLERLAMGPVWARSQIERFKDGRDRSRTAREA